jgi:hypothetical protein
MSDSLLSKQRNKILEKFADHILKESCPHCQHIVREALITKGETHCNKFGEWLDGLDVCSECGENNKRVLKSLANLHIL